MKRITLASTFLLFSFALLADCGRYGISIFPSVKTIKQNSIFVIEGYGASQEVIKKLNSNYSIYLKSGDQVVSLKVDRLYASEFELTQAVLKPEKTLEAGLSYQLIIDSLPNYHRPRRYNKDTGEHEAIIYTVKSVVDKEKPEIIETPKEVDKSYAMYGCGPAMSVIFNCPVKDDSELLVKATVKSKKSKKEQTFIVETTNNQIQLGHGMCSGAFVFREGDDYEVQFTFMDASGNITELKDQSIAFTKPSPEDWRMED